MKKIYIFDQREIVIPSSTSGGGDVQKSVETKKQKRKTGDHKLFIGSVILEKVILNV